MLAFCVALGQTYEISGTIKDESGGKVSNARLTLYSSKYQLVKTERTKGNGKFKFNIEKTDKIPKMGEYLLFRPPAKSELEENDEMLQLKEELRI
mgnify:CR=1 FL=1